MLAEKPFGSLDVFWTIVAKRPRQSRFYAALMSERREILSKQSDVLSQNNRCSPGGFSSCRLSNVHLMTPELRRRYWAHARESCHDDMRSPDGIGH